jgi:hypothetical protein
MSDILLANLRVASVFCSSLCQIVAARPLAMLRMAMTIDSVEPGEMGRAGVVGDHMVGDELMGILTKVLTAMADILQEP